MQSTMARAIRRSAFRAAIASCLLAGPGFSVAVMAQTPEPQPSPSPSPKPFKSPLLKKTVEPGEEAAFNNLVQLFLENAKLQDAARKAKACGSKADADAAAKAAEEAYQKYAEALRKYVRDYSSNLYSENLTPHTTASENFTTEVRMADIAVREAAKYTPEPAANCPKQDSRTLPLPETPKPEDGLPGIKGQTGLLLPDIHLDADYARLMPQTGSDADQFGIGLVGLLPLSDTIGLNLGASYHNVSSTSSVDSVQAGAALVFQQPTFRIAPVFNYQSNSYASFSVNTYNYGVAGDYYPGDNWTVSARAGGFDSGRRNDGYYLGGGLKGYFGPAFSLAGNIDYFYISTAAASGSETDYNLTAEYRTGWRDISLYGGYTFSQFAPGSFNVSAFSVGVRVPLNGVAPSLVEQDRTGAISTYFYPVALRL